MTIIIKHPARFDRCSTQLSCSATNWGVSTSSICHAWYALWKRPFVIFVATSSDATQKFVPLLLIIFTHEDVPWMHFHRCRQKSPSALNDDDDELKTYFLCHCSCCPLNQSARITHLYILTRFSLCGCCTVTVHDSQLKTLWRANESEKTFYWSKAFLLSSVSIF